MMSCDNNNEQIVNVIEQLKLVENKLEQLRVFYEENKDTFNFEIVATFYDNFIEIHITNEFSVFFSNDNYKNFLKYYKHYCDYPTVVDFDKKGKECFHQIYIVEQNKLFLKKLILKQKLAYYENLIKKQHNSVITSVIFFIMIMFTVIAVMISVIVLNNNDNTDINFMLNHMQCIRLIDKHNKLKDTF